MFLTADGEADKPLGNETIRVHPEAGWLELKLPAPLAHLANAPHGRYRLSCPVAFTHRRGEWAAQAASGVPLPDVIDFVNASLATGYAEFVPETAPEPAEAPKSGLFGRRKK